jgi:cytidine deaminase
VPDVDDAKLDELVSAARAVRGRAYAPYSAFLVGAALLSEDGTIYPGVNIENASYPLSVCAERNAVAMMLVAGRRRLLAVGVATDAERPTPPCGGCRQVLWEFGGPDTIVVAEGGGDARARWRLGDLLPDAFGPDDLS